MTHIKLVALDIDGVLLEDTFSPVIRKVVEDLGGTYDRELESSVFSQNRNKAARYLITRLSLDWSEEKMLEHYFRERATYLQSHDGGLRKGTLDLLGRLRDQGLRLLSYGGLERSHFDTALKQGKHFFEDYICTNDIRPGVREILAASGLAATQILFVDDVARPAQACKDLRVPFLGMPASPSTGFQREEMSALGVKYLVEGPWEFTGELWEHLDSDAEKELFWT